MLSQQHSFPPTKSQHRLSTVTLSQVIAHAPGRLSTGLAALDESLGGTSSHDYTSAGGSGSVNGNVNGRSKGNVNGNSKGSNNGNGSSSASSHGSSYAGGIPRNGIFEVYGCPGSGKTTFGMQVAARAVQQGQRVVWLECAQRLPAARLRDFLQHSCAHDYRAYKAGADHDDDEQSDAGRNPNGSHEAHVDDDDDEDDDDDDGGEGQESRVRRRMKMVQCISTPTLTSLLALLLTCGPDSSSQPSFIDAAGNDDDDVKSRKRSGQETSLIVLDDLTTLYNAAFPPDSHKETNLKKSKMMSTLADLLARLAATQNIAVLVLAKLTSRITKGGPAQLESPFGDAWSARCLGRIVLYRDHSSPRQRQTQESAIGGIGIAGDNDVRWVAVQKVGNRNILDPQGLAFKIVGSGMVSVEVESSQASRSRSQTPGSSLRGTQPQTLTQTLTPSALQVSVGSDPIYGKTRPATPEPAIHNKRAKMADAKVDDSDDGIDAALQTTAGDSDAEVE